MTFSSAPGYRVYSYTRSSKEFDVTSVLATLNTVLYMLFSENPMSAR